MELFRKSLRQQRIWDGLLDTVLATLGRAAKRAHSRPCKRSVLLSLEQLEDRQMPSALSGITEYSIPTTNANTFWLTLGPDGKVWGNEQNTQKIFKIDTSGNFTEYTNTGYEAMDITSGPDSNIWFTETKISPPGWGVAKSTTSGSITNYSVGMAQTFAAIDSTLGPDGKIWFTDGTNNKVDKINTDGTGFTRRTAMCRSRCRWISGRACRAPTRPTASRPCPLWSTGPKASMCSP
jgi:streptogramin lyase